MLHYKKLIILTTILSMGFFSCERFFDPEQELIVKEEDMFSEWFDYRSAEMGLYSLMQDLVDQIWVLGELRGDLLMVTDNASPDLVNVCNFNITRDNKYASPTNFYRLIAACNNLIRQLKREHPEVMNGNGESYSNYDRLYGEVMCTRAWAYFNAARIYGKIPYFPESLTTEDEIVKYVNSGGEFVDSLDIIYNPQGHYDPNKYPLYDTIRNETIVLPKIYLDMETVIDTFTNQLENEVNIVGLIHNATNEDVTWDVSGMNMQSIVCSVRCIYSMEISRKPGIILSLYYMIIVLKQSISDMVWMISLPRRTGKISSLPLTLMNIFLQYGLVNLTDRRIVFKV